MQVPDKKKFEIEVLKVIESAESGIALLEWTLEFLKEKELLLEFQAFCIQKHREAEIELNIKQ